MISGGINVSVVVTYSKNKNKNLELFTCMWCSTSNITLLLP